eukprot:m.177429 g.177429  ORF g.177429 m.177429 type:complete len:236 (-) comp16572_c0_seq2:2398-3105(-)
MDDSALDRWQALLAAVPEIQGQPTAAEMEALKQNKEDKKLFLESLTDEQKKQAKAIEKDFKKSQKQSKPKPEKNSEEAAQRQQAKAEATQRQREAAALKQQKKQAKAEAQALQKPLETLCKWLKIKCRLVETDGDMFFDIQLPKWLTSNDEYLDAFDLDEGSLSLEPQELEAACLGAVEELAKAYFGPEFAMDFPLDNLVERVETEKQVIQRAGLPPWYQHMSYPLTEEELSVLT